MFLVSTRLGIIACRYLVSGYYQGRYVSAPEIAEAYKMNVRALMPALRQLSKTGILRSRVGGKEPGFIFSKSPKEITMLDVIISLEGSNDMPCCKELVAGLACDCRGVEECIIYKLFNGVTEETRLKLSKVTVEQHAELAIQLIRSKKLE